MTCEMFQSLLDEYENLTDEQKLNMTLHTAECESCRNDLDFMLSIISVTKNLPPLKSPDNFISDLNKRIDLEEIKQRHRLVAIRKYMTEWKRYGAVAACLLLAVVVGFNGKSLVFDMTNNSSGVISEEVVAVETLTDATAENNLPTIGAAKKTTEEKVPVAPESKEKAKVTEKKQKTTVKNVVKATAVPKKPSVSNENTALQTQTPIAEDKQDNVNVSTPSPTAETTPSVASTDDSYSESKPYTLQRDGYKIPQDSVAVASVNESGKNSVASGYAVAGDTEQLALGLYTPLDTNGNPTDYDFSMGVIADSPIVDSIMVSSEDEAVVRDLISRYITGNYGMYFMSTEDKLNKLFDELDKAGISYEKFLKSSTNKISFKLVVVS